MEEPQKPFACTMPDCGMTFTNEDHLHVHSKKHDMVLQFGSEQKGAFVDQTPTPTRFITHCEEVGLFQDLQHVNPFEDGFKRAIEAKHNLLNLEKAIASSSGEDLHTPHFPLIDAGDSTLFSTTNNQRNITISRSSSDESGSIKEFETTTISKLTNEVTTISRIVEKHEDQTKNDVTRENQKKDSVSYMNNVIKIHSNVEIRKDHDLKNPVQTLIYEDTVIKDGNIIAKDVVHNENKLNVPVPPMMSQKSIDFVVDSLTTDLCCPKDDSYRKSDTEKSENYEVIIKFPSGRQVRMKSVEEINANYDKDQVVQGNLKEKLKKAITEKNKPAHSMPVMPNIVPISGTLIPVTIVNSVAPKVPIVPFKVDNSGLKRKKSASEKKTPVRERLESCDKKSNGSTQEISQRDAMESRSAASRRYRARLKEAWQCQQMEIKELKEKNETLRAELATLQLFITEHMKKCPNPDDLSITKEKINL